MIHQHLIVVLIPVNCIQVSLDYLMDYAYGNFSAYVDTIKQQKWTITSRVNRRWITEYFCTVIEHRNNGRQTVLSGFSLATLLSW